jgi:quercetin dioxygenase-like cupin family protein
VGAIIVLYKFWRKSAKKMEKIKVAQAKVLNIEDVIEYVSGSIVSRIVIEKITGNISAVSFDSGKSLPEKTIAFDTFIQIIEGTAEIIIDGIPNILNKGQSIIVPAHTSNTVRANERFKMISTIIKSGYE